MDLLETIHARTTEQKYLRNVGVVQDMISFMSNQRRQLMNRIDTIDLQQVKQMKEDRLTKLRLKHTQIDTEAMRKKVRPAWKGAGSKNQQFSKSSRLGPLQLNHWQRFRLGQPERAYRIPQGKKAIQHTHVLSRPIPPPTEEMTTPNIREFAKRQYSSFINYKERPSKFIQTVESPSILRNQRSFRGDAVIKDFGFNKTLGTIGWKFRNYISKPSKDCNYASVTLSPKRSGQLMRSNRAHGINKSFEFNSAPVVDRSINIDDHNERMKSLPPIQQHSPR